MSTVLQVQKLSIEFGGLKAVTDFNLNLENGELAGLIGPNGAGKTTVFNMLTGVYMPTSGSIGLGGKSLLGMTPHNITRHGIARTFQNIRLFKEMTVLENVLISYHSRIGYSFLSGMLHLPVYRQKETEMRLNALDLLSIFHIDGKQDELAKNLPYGEQRKLEIVRALATQPTVLLLDEPAAGMNPQETRDLMKLIRFIRDKFKLTILLIEHDMSLVMGICERILVLDYGQTIATGTPDQISKNPMVIKAYLGEEAEFSA
jgi:branched-chain amino acid transport system ATP-binding protein